MCNMTTKNLTVVIVLTALLSSAAWSAAHSPGRNKVAKTAKVPPANMAQAQALFSQSCAPCHGADASGGEGPNLKHKGLPAAVITETIHNGVKGQMPAFGSSMTKLQEDGLVKYIRSLQ